MARKFQFQKIRTKDGKPGRRPEEENGQHWEISPLDVALLAVILLIVIWLQWLTGVMSN